MPSHLIDLMPTCMEVAGAKLPKEWNGKRTAPLEGISLVSFFKGQRKATRTSPLFWEHEGHRAVRVGNWKLVASHNEPWALYDLEADRTELNDKAGSEPRRVRKLVREYEAWAERAGVKPWPDAPAKSVKTKANQ